MVVHDQMHSSNAGTQLILEHSSSGTDGESGVHGRSDRHGNSGDAKITMADVGGAWDVDEVVHQHQRSNSVLGDPTR